MTVESLISKAIAEEVEKVFSREKVEEIFDLKIKRHLQKMVKKQLEKKDFLKEVILDYFDTYHARNILENIIKENLKVSFSKKG